MTIHRPQNLARFANKRQVECDVMIGSIADQLRARFNMPDATISQLEARATGVNDPYAMRLILFVRSLRGACSALLTAQLTVQK